MICPDFTEASLRSLLEAICDRTCSFMEDELVDPIYLRFDIDDDFRKAVTMAEICSQHGINATFFILNTAPYWNDSKMFDNLLKMQAKGHEIGWHNNGLTEYIQKQGTPDLLYRFIWQPLSDLRSEDINIRGSASHGDPLCHKLGYLNYEVFKECPRTQEAINFPKPSFTIPQVSMHDFGLEYEAYHVPYDLYLSESGGRSWNRTFTAEDLAAHDRVQILIHPQHWKI